MSPPRRAPRRLGLRVTSAMYARVEMLLGIVSLTAGLLALMYLFPEAWWTDRRFTMPRQLAFSQELMLVGLDERYAERHGYGPTSPAYLAAVVRASLAFDPTAIALDFRLGEGESGSPGMDSLAAAVHEANRRGVPVVIPTVLATWQGKTAVARTPPVELSGLVVGGFVGWNMPGGGPGGGLPQPRDFPAAEPLSETCYALSFPVAAVAAHRGKLARSTRECLGLGTVPDTALERLLRHRGRTVQHRTAVPLYFAGPVRHTREMLFYSSEEMRQDIAAGAVFATMRNKLVLVAALYPHPGGEDAVVTPFGPARGGLVHLYAIDTLLRDGVPRPAGRAVTLVLAALVFGGIIGVWQRWQARAWLISAGVLAGYVALGFVLFAGSGVLLPIATPLWAGLFAAALGFILFGEGEPGEPTLARGNGTASVRTALPTSPPAGLGPSTSRNPRGSARRIRGSNLLLMLTRGRRRS